MIVFSHDTQLTFTVCKCICPWNVTLYTGSINIYIYIYIVHISIKKFLTKVGLQLFQLLASRKSCGRFTGN